MLGQPERVVDYKEKVKDWKGKEDGDKTIANFEVHCTEANTDFLKE